MADKANGSGSAADASIKTGGAPVADIESPGDAAVRRAQAKVEWARQQVKEAEESLRIAKAERKDN